MEPTNLGLGTPDAAALIVRTVRGWANDMAVTPKVGQDADAVLPIDLENACGRTFRSTCLEAARSACPQLAATVRHNWNPVTRGSGRDATMAGPLTARREEAALNRSWNVIDGTLAGAGHRPRGYKCGVWAPGFEQFEDAELPTEVRSMCLEVPRKRQA